VRRIIGASCCSFMDVVDLTESNRASSDSSSRRRGLAEVVDLTAENSQTSTPFKKVKTARDFAGHGERRHAFRYWPTKELQANIEKAKRDNLFLILRRSQPLKDDSTSSFLELKREFVVLGTTGNVYHVTISQVPSCDCGDNCNGTSPHSCKHILFVLLKVYQLPVNDPRVYQRALTNSELRNLFGQTFVVPSAMMATSTVTEKYLALTRKKKPIPVEQRLVDGDCPICYEKMKPQSEALVYCKYSCGNSIHDICFNSWQKIESNGLKLDKLNCIYCRSPWDPDQLNAQYRKNGYWNLAELQNPQLTSSSFVADPSAAGATTVMGAIALAMMSRYGTAIPSR